MTTDEMLEPVASLIRRTGGLARLLLLIFVCAGLVGYALTLLPGPPDIPSRVLADGTIIPGETFLGDSNFYIAGWLAAVFFGVMTLFTLLMLAEYLRVESNPFYVTLRERPQDIVWIYVIAMNYRTMGIRTKGGRSVALGLSDRTTHRLNFISEEEVQTVLGIASVLAPEATLGFSKENALLFQRNPSSLKVGPP